MSYRRTWLKKTRRAKTIAEMQHRALRDWQWCERHGIPESEAWQWNRLPDRTAASPAWGGAWR